MQEALQKIIQSKSKTFLAFCFCFILGAGAASLLNWSISNIQYSISFYLFLSLFILFFISILVWNKSLPRFFILCFVFIIFGLWRFIITIPDCTNPHNFCSYNGRKVEFTGVVSEDPDIRIDQARYMIDIRSVILSGAKDLVGRPSELDSSSLRSLGMTSGVSGRILVTTRLYPIYNYAERLKLVGKIDKPENKDDSTFRYDKYLARNGVWSVSSNPRIIVIPTVIPSTSSGQALSKAKDLARGQLDSSVAEFTLSRANVLSQNDNWGVLTMKQILRFKSKVQNQIENLWNEPESSLMAGLLYGSRSSLPPAVVDNFNKTGLSHIVAVSGFNVTIIATVLMSVLIYLGLWRQQAFWITVSGIIFFIVFTGLSASAVRAGIMAIIVLTGQYLGRLSRIGNVLVFTAALMTLVNPYVLVWDAGFQLSFLATLGLVYISPVLESVIARKEERLTKQSPDRSDNSVDKINPENKGIATSLTITAKDAPRNDTVECRSALFIVWNLIREPLVQTLSAIIATLPLILYQFGRLSLVAPLLNVLILWIIPWLMLIGFIALVFSFIFFPFGQLIAYVAHFGLGYVIMMVEWFGNQPWSAVQFQIPWWFMLILYGVLVIVIARRSKATTKQSLC